MIETLTPEQEDLMEVYDVKWRQIMYSTEPIDRDKSAEAVKQAYLAIDEKEPEILFCGSPYEAANLVIGCESLPQLYEEFGVNLFKQFAEQLYNETWENISEQLSDELSGTFYPEAWNNFSDIFKKLLETSIGHVEFFSDEENYAPLDSIVWAEFAADCDFCFSVLKCKHNPIKWQALQSFTTQCGWIFPYEKICIVCDRPRILSFDSQHRLHAEGGPAIQFADGYSIYSYHGVTLPEKYGKLHPREWQPQWLLEEENAELRRVLIQGIGYDRIARELAAVELDTWQEYTLLKIDTNFDVEPIYLLKMTCPSTGFIHALRVPPDINSAREAIRWTNWGVDPEEFSVQT
ncbi:MAG: hypothetical protein JGK17_06935 [Microcoleus sp. PH2017_10_PVI_O_A]|uniref:DUF6745 domain-containing protein n=1 Tax=unclassified Microcoleus TaxID=2642155 RepID=UPI001DD2E0F4|nr:MULTISPECIES: hypothetical protein [unclassified Microcoleus]TAE83358.1 MAG: hypothetical protein EAZ83_09510 [Oscillatoriales cyanobacterium]MCC3405320.1 hypothetical protein [Microcoleus sp. PH2017_10_PVI_O_A]MCC3460397.1 hypothetical protein [Microcoleus sp. PH2017_11_PCY_U_A]MCC3478683.1 hypothetical protein [Microcoleus sp. PH2017_12_PCY_D_A]MCC3559616.1 hypothetical protein [Microcoleus sp. PH2017_27_LUM_O_A]